MATNLPAKPRKTRKAGAALAVSGQTVELLRRKVLLPYQARWATSQARFMAGVWGRQTGKSFATAFLIACSLCCNPGVEWMIAAPSARQSNASLDKVKDWIEALGVFFRDEVPALRDVDEKSTCIVLANGSRCTAVPGKPDTVRGFSANVWLDEFAFFEQPDATWRAILPSITNPLRGGQKRVVITSTPNGKAGRGKRFYEICSRPQGKRMSWEVQANPLKAAIAEGLPVDYDELAEAIGDPIAVAQELDGTFLDTCDTLLPLDIIALAESGEASLVAPADFWRTASSRQLVCGIDFGRTNDPTVCWTLERCGDVWITREVLVLRDMDTPTQEAILRSRIKCAGRVCFDYTGPGIGLGDYLAKEFGEWKPERHEFGLLELCTFSAVFKRDIFPKLRRWFEAPVRLRIPASDEVRDDLHAMQQLVRNGEYTYAAPHTADGHSDRCTALALAVRAASGAAITRDLPHPVSLDLLNSSAAATRNPSITSRPF